MMQSKYDFAMLNDWDGSLTLNEENGTILSTMLGAGRKNKDNSFSGVLIGDVEAGTGLNSVQKATGVYGIHKGQLSYGFRDDGTGFIGKAGQGQILLDGNKSYIRNAEYLSTTENEKGEEVDNGTGMQIDLDQGIIDIKNKGATKIHISPNFKENDENAYFTVKGKNGTLIHVDDDNYYLQSNSYESGIGTKLDLVSGNLEIKNSTGKFYASGGNVEGIKPFLQIALSDDSGTSYTRNLLLISPKDYYLQSGSYEARKIQEYNNGIKGYEYKIGTLSLEDQDNLTYKETSDGPDFKLQIGDVFVITSDKNKDFYKLNTTDNTVTKITFNKQKKEYTTEDDKPIIVELTESQVKQLVMAMLLPIYVETTKSDPEGFKLDLINNKIYGNNLYLSGKNNSTGKTFELDSGAPTFPFSIGDNFKIDWDGNATTRDMTCNNLTVMGNSNIGGNTKINLGSFYMTSSGAGGGTWGGYSTGIKNYTPTDITSFGYKLWVQ